MYVAYGEQRSYRDWDFIDVSKVWGSHKGWGHVLGIKNIDCYSSRGGQHLVPPFVLSTSILWKQRHFTVLKLFYLIQNKNTLNTLLKNMIWMWLSPVMWWYYYDPFRDGWWNNKKGSTLHLQLIIFKGRSFREKWHYYWQVTDCCHNYKVMARDT